jgi:hypothetical protein
MKLVSNEMKTLARGRLLAALPVAVVAAFAVELAEGAAATAAAIAMWERRKRVDARLTSSVMGQAPLSDVQAGAMATTARLNASRQAAQPVWGALDPTTASQAAIVPCHSPAI